MSLKYCLKKGKGKISEAEKEKVSENKLEDGDRSKKQDSGK